MNNKNFSRIFRWFILTVVLAYVTIEAYLHQTLGGQKAASVHALCPFGGLESLYTWLFTGAMIQKIYLGTMVIFFLTLLLALLFRRSFCGILCPFGALQEILAMLGKAIFGRWFTMPRKIDALLRYLKYAILVVTVVAAWITGGLWMSAYDPYVAYGHISSGWAELWGENSIGVILLIFTIIGSVVYNRFFCKYLCPAGAFYALVGKISPHKIVRDYEKCSNCKLCNKVCPVNLEVSNLSTISSGECINCQECIVVCPNDKALLIKQGKKSFNPLVITILVISLFLGGVLISKYTGIYKVTPGEVNKGTLLKVEDVKGYMTLEDLAKGLNINIDEVYHKLNLSKEVSPTTKLKDIDETVKDFNVEEAKELLIESSN